MVLADVNKPGDDIVGAKHTHYTLDNPGRTFCGKEISRSDPRTIEHVDSLVIDKHGAPRRDENGELVFNKPDCWKCGLASPKLDDKIHYRSLHPEAQLRYAAQAVAIAVSQGLSEELGSIRWRADSISERSDAMIWKEYLNRLLLEQPLPAELKRELQETGRTAPLFE